MKRLASIALPDHLGQEHFRLGFGRYKFQHEPIFYCHIAGQSDSWYGDKTQSTLWNEKTPTANRLHPTIKPVELIERALLDSSKRGDLVLDLFGGSGSTLIACQKSGRAARVLELDPKYADVIVQRWQDYAGKSATLDADGRWFAQIEQSRKRTMEEVSMARPEAEIELAELEEVALGIPTVRSYPMAGGVTLGINMGINAVEREPRLRYSRAGGDIDSPRHGS